MPPMSAFSLSPVCAPVLVARPSLIALENLGPGGPFSDMPPAVTRALLEKSELIAAKANTDIVEQYHRGKYFYFLIHGDVDFLLSLESAEQSLCVGRSDQVWTPVGWSVFRAPHRYATTIRTRAYSEFLRFNVDDLHRFFEEHPDAGASFFQAVCQSAEGLLEEVRERLVDKLNPETHMPNWGTSSLDQGDDEPSSGEFEARPSPLSDLSPRIAAEEAMVTNAAPLARDVILLSPFFDGLPDELLNEIAQLARVEYFCRGQLIRRSRSGGADMLVLAGGRVRPEYTGTCRRTLALRSAVETGHILGWTTQDSATNNDVRLRATRDGSLLRLSRSSLKRLFLRHPRWACLFQKRVLWLLSQRLRSTRAHLVSESFEQEVLAIDNVLEQVRTELRVSSPLHRLPHLIRAAVTLPDALRIIDRAKESRDSLERNTALLCSELLTPLRKEARFFAGLQATYEEVVDAPQDTPHDDLRRRNAESFIRVFSEIPTRIDGLENLPKSAGNIFIFNHLRNHEHNTLPNGFQLTLDSHFISAMILHKKYGDPGVRVVRQSRAGEYGHHSYYSRLGHISVYTRESDIATSSGGQRLAEFLQASETHLNRGRNLVMAPEGTSLGTDESPGPLKAGAFRLAGSLKSEPLIVPIAVANFDRRLGKTTLSARILKPFKMKERVKDINDQAEMSAFLELLRGELKSEVQEAIATRPRRGSAA